MKTTRYVVDSITWYIETWLSNHMVYINKLLIGFDHSKRTNIMLGDNNLMKVEGMRNILLHL